MDAIFTSGVSKSKWVSVFLFLIAMNIFLAKDILAQKVCGIVVDAESKEPLIGASVYFLLSKNGVSTDDNGFFCLTSIKTENEKVQVSYIGYKTSEIEISNQSTDSLIIISLRPGISIDEVTVAGRLPINKSNGIIEIPISLIRKLPNLVGEPDLMKSFQLMPGVKMGDEGSSVFYVRGGTPDQNLTLLDDVPLYYVNHLGGFLSVFDISTIKKATLYKGYFPPHFGGRLSSVLDIRLKDGNVKNSKKEFMLGTLASKFFIEGPIIENKLSGMFSFRRCNLDLLMRPLTAMNSNGKDISSYTFFDLTSKATYSVNPRNKFSMMLYAGRDKLYFKEKDNASYLSILNNNWGNVAGSVKWTHFSKGYRVFVTGVNFSKFFRVFANKETIYSEKENYTSKGSFISKIGDVTFFSQTNKAFHNFNIKTGIEVTLHKFTPTAIKSIEEGTNLYSDTLFLNNLNVAELKGYIGTNWDITDRLNISSGFFAMYWGKINFASIDPRISVNFSLPKSFFLKASYSMNHQYIHLLSNNSGGLPVDLWIPSSETIQPEKSEQIAMAFSKQVKTIDFSVEVYLKKMDNLIYYKPGFNLFNTLNWDDAIEKQGEGFSKGVELLIQKDQGKNTGWFGYTLSKDTRSFENINSGKIFPFKYGRLHEINLVFARELSKNISLSATWVFASGNFVTLAKQSFPAIDFNYRNNNYLETTLVDAHYYGNSNNFKTANYHRLDIGLNFKKQLKKSERNIYVGVYNLYNKRNPYYYYFKTTESKRNMYQFSMFPIIPSVSFTYKW